MIGFAEFITEMYQEIEAADAKHGDWQERSFVDCSHNICDEAEEVLRAACAGDIDSLHGVKRESIQVAATAFKMWRHAQQA